MRTFIKLLTVAAILSAPAVTLAAGGGGAALDPFTPERTDRTLQRGARLFMNYCLGCHTADYHRYSHMARDIGLSEEDVVENLVFTTDDAGEKTKVGSLIASNMTADYAEEAFGVKPPNLALVSRSRGVDWLYTFMRSFYLDESRPLGANNALYPQVGMPHVLAGLQGWRKPIYTTDDNGYEKLDGFQQVTSGSLTADEYDAAITDLVSFLDYLGDPNKEARHSLGIKVMLFLLVFLILAVMLKREYWKDVPH